MTASARRRATTEPMTEEQLAEMETRALADERQWQSMLEAFEGSTSRLVNRSGWEDRLALIAEVRRLRAELASIYNGAPQVSVDETIGSADNGPPPGYELAVAEGIPGVRGPRPYWRPIGAAHTPLLGFQPATDTAADNK